MMLYVATFSNYEDCHIVGVYSDLEPAKTAAKTALDRVRDLGYFKCAVTEAELDTLNSPNELDPMYTLDYSKDGTWVALD